MRPRNYSPLGSILSHDYKSVLEQHPEAFDCIVFPAKSPEHDETIAVNESVATVLESDSRAQKYDTPVYARAMLVPKQELDYDATESGQYEAFTDSSDAINLMLSVQVRRYSLIQWLEYIALDRDETIERTVYVRDILPLGRTLTAGATYVCYPLPAVGEVPTEKPVDTNDDLFVPYGG